MKAEAKTLVLDDLSEQEIVALNTPRGVPLLYELDAKLEPISNRYLGHQDAIKAVAEAVKRQTDRIERQIHIKAKRSRVWRALTNAQELSRWLKVDFAMKLC